MASATDARESLRNLILCAAAAMAEGYDNQSMGVAAPKFVPEFGLTAFQASMIFSATTFGLFIGAALGGRIADRWGRRRTLVAALLVFGIFSLVTACVSGPTALFAVRLLTGLGLGAAMPNFIAVASESAPSNRRLTAVTLVMAGMPFGGLLAGLVALVTGSALSWRTIFYVGGTAPLVLAFLVWRGLRPKLALLASQAPAEFKLEGVRSVLFGRGRALTTWELWGGFFFTQLILLLMLNWLPSLFLGLGFSRSEASVASMCFNLFGAVGAVFLGRVHSGANRRLWVVITYAGVAFALVLIPMTGNNFFLAAVATSLAGIFIVGAQLVLFALAPLYYEQPTRGTGVGAAVAVGRLGSVVGPLYAGALLTFGGGSGAVLLGIVPFVILGGMSAVALTRRDQGGMA